MSLMRKSAGRSITGRYPEKETTVKAESEAFLNRVFDGKIGLMVSSLVDDHLSDEEADELIRLLEKKLGDK